MQLKRIELEGFKSFADRTVVPVEGGLTGIVGPNGCGKSNVVDALLWVLGERSAKILRADAMGDVIFQGAEGRTPGPYALVEIVLEDDEGLYAEAGSELAIGRRLFRNGDSEFLLNGRKVRRKDVREVLMGSGLGVRGYMVLAQGKIDAVLAANPKDRRSVFEEAAGISRYKARKHETKLKLDATAQNLARIDDVLGEVQRAVRSLRLQAGKAKRFVEARDRYRELRIQVAWVDDASLREQERSLRRTEGELEREIKALRVEREQADERLRKVEAEELALRESYENLRNDAADTKEQAAGLEERVRGLEARASEFDQRARREQERMEDLERVSVERKQALEEFVSEIEKLVEARAAAESKLNKVSELYEAARDEQRVLRDRIEDLRKQVLQALGDRTRFNNTIEEATQRRSECEGALRVLQRRKSESEAESERLAAQLEAAGTALALCQAKVDSSEGEAAQMVTTRDGLRERAEAFGKSARAAQAREAEGRARLEALAGIEERQEELPESIREALKQPPEGVAGLLLEGVRIASPWDRLLENLLGRVQHALWIEDPSRIAGLRDKDWDLFFPTPQVAEPAAIAGAQPLIDLLEGDEARCRALGTRLRGVYCVENAHQAAELSKQHPEVLFLSRDGELHGSCFARVGMLQSEAIGLLARRNAREASRQQVDEAERERIESSRKESETRAELSQVDAQLEVLAGDLRTALSERDRARSRADEIERRRDALLIELRALTLEEQQQDQELQRAREEEQTATSERDLAEGRRRSATEQLEAAEERATASESEFEQSRAAWQEARMEHDRLGTELEHLEQRRAEAEQNVALGSEERSRLQEEWSEVCERATSLRTEADHSREKTRALLSQRGELEERVQQAGELARRAAAAVKQERGRRETEGGRLEQLLESRQTQALERQRAHMQREELARGLVEEFHQSLDELARAQGLEQQKRPSEDEHRARSEELGELRRKLESIGSVNLDAVKELEEREEREAFLVREREDLVAAGKRLEETLEELDELCRSRFVETFEAVKVEFESIFRRLFRGGKAELTLPPEEDPLDSGIDIHVRPPGKELRSINLLSGGERTLTALALLLGVFRSKPSPFCLLDEVDAALDDSNVERFLDVVNDFTDGTQFIVVTHNRITMGNCQRLFGVTMRRRGVSQLVAVEVDDVVHAQAEGSAGLAAALERQLPVADRGRGGIATPAAERPGAGDRVERSSESESLAEG